MGSEEIRVFHDDDEGYKEWMAQWRGFVLTRPRKGEHMLHIADCIHLRTANSALRLTRKPRRWSSCQEPLVAWAEQETGARPMLCRSCM